MEEIKNIDSPLVSACIFTYNQEQTIAQTIESVLQQNCNFEYEIIIGEDCSTDSTLEICRQYESLHPDRIRVMTPEKNAGFMNNFKRVTDSIKGKYFACCAGDDFWHDPNKLQLQYDFMENNPDCGMVHSGCNYFFANTGKQEEVIRSYPSVGDVFDSILKTTYGVTAPTAFVRTSIFKKYVSVKDYIQKGYIMEDYPMWLDISFHSHVGYIPNALATYRIADESLSYSKNPLKKLQFLNNRNLIQYDFIDKYDVNTQVITHIKKERNRICISNAFCSNSFKESFFWLRNVSFTYIIKYASLKQRLYLLLSLLSIRSKQVETIKKMVN